MTCNQIKLPFLLPTLSSLSPIPHSLLLPLTHSLSFSHPLSFPSIPRPLCFTLSLLISPSALSYMLNFSSPFYLAWKIFTFNLSLKTFYSVSENHPLYFLSSKQGQYFFFNRHSGNSLLTVDTLMTWMFFSTFQNIKGCTLKALRGCHKVKVIYYGILQ